MSKSKIVGLVAFIAFAIGILLAGNALSGEYVKAREVMFTTKWEQINVGDEKDHVVAVGEFKGINLNMQGKTFLDGFLNYSVGYYDISPKNGLTGNGYATYTSKDGDKIYFKHDQKGLSGTWTILNGTGKFEGIQGKGTWSWVPSADPKMGYTEWEGEMELPR